jgi:hypothetical protein
MIKRVFLAMICMFCLFTSCKEVYRDEIFNNQYIVIYGEWKHLGISGSRSGMISSDNYTLKFTPIGKFSYNNGKTGIITIKIQNENALLLDFNSLFPKASEAYIYFHGDDTMSIADTGTDMSSRLFVRISK